MKVVKACLYRARPRPRTRLLRLFPRLSAGKFTRATVHTERGKIRALTAALCAALHHVMKMAGSLKSEGPLSYEVGVFHLQPLAFSIGRWQFKLSVNVFKHIA